MALLPFVAMSFTGGHDHDEDCDCGCGNELDMDNLKAQIAELEGVTEKSVEQVEQLAELYIVQATCKWQDADMSDSVVPCFDKAENVLKDALAKNEDAELRRKLGNVYLNRGVMCNDFDEIEPALEYYGKAIEAFKPLEDAGDGEAKFDIAGIRLNRGTVYHEIGEYEKAQVDYDESFMAFRAVEKISGDVDMDTVDTRYYMAKVSVAQGALLRDMGEPLDKIVDAYNRAMRLYVELIDIGQLEHEQELANTLMDRCTATYEDYMSRDFGSDAERQEKFNELLVDVERGVEILERLDETGDEETRLDLFHALSTQGTMLLDLEKYEEAQKIFDRLIGEFEDFGTDVDPLLLNQYAAVFENRGVCHLNLDSTTDALVDFDEAIRIRESILSDEFELDDDAKAFFTPTLATNYANRANAYAEMEDVKKALEDGQKGLDLIRSLPDNDDFKEIEQLFENLLEQWK